MAVQHDQNARQLVRQLDAEFGSGEQRRLAVGPLPLRDDETMAESGVVPGATIHLLPLSDVERRSIIGKFLIFFFKNNNFKTFSCFSCVCFQMVVQKLPIICEID